MGKWIKEIKKKGEKNRMHPTRVTLPHSKKASVFVPKGAEFSFDND